jgi:monofunctional biosynthetic peptidoglycan transglycosylase
LTEITQSNDQNLKVKVKVKVWRWFKSRWKIIVIIGGALFVGTLFICLSLFHGLPNENEITSYQPKNTISPGLIDWSARNEDPIRIWVPLDKISPLLQTAVIISEDDLFYTHNGVNYDMLYEAFKINLSKKRYVRGASTITMQLARNAFLNKRKTLLRKIREIIIAKRMEKYLSKKRILELYINIAEWGDGIFGIEAAARFYFKKHASELNLAESTLLAGMLPNPHYFNPLVRLKSCKRMQKRVLELMNISKKISNEQVEFAFSEPLPLRNHVTKEEDLASIKIDSSEEKQYLFDIPEKLKLVPRTPKLDSIKQDSNGLSIQ